MFNYNKGRKNQQTKPYYSVESFVNLFWLGCLWAFNFIWAKQKFYNLHVLHNRSADKKEFIYIFWIIVLVCMNFYSKISLSDNPLPKVVEQWNINWVMTAYTWNVSTVCNCTATSVGRWDAWSFHHAETDAKKYGDQTGYSDWWSKGSSKQGANTSKAWHQHAGLFLYFSSFLSLLRCNTEVNRPSSIFLDVVNLPSSPYT